MFEPKSEMSYIDTQRALRGENVDFSCQWFYNDRHIFAGAHMIECIRMKQHVRWAFVSCTRQTETTARRWMAEGRDRRRESEQSVRLL